MPGHDVVTFYFPTKAGATTTVTVNGPARAVQVAALLAVYHTSAAMPVEKSATMTPASHISCAGPQGPAQRGTVHMAMSRRASSSAMERRACSNFQ